MTIIICASNRLSVNSVPLWYVRTFKSISMFSALLGTFQCCIIIKWNVYILIITIFVTLMLFQYSFERWDIVKFTGTIFECQNVSVKYFEKVMPWFHRLYASNRLYVSWYILESQIYAKTTQLLNYSCSKLFKFQTKVQSCSKELCVKSYPVRAARV